MVVVAEQYWRPGTTARSWPSWRGWSSWSWPGGNCSWGSAGRPRHLASGGRDGAAGRGQGAGLSKVQVWWHACLSQERRRAAAEEATRKSVTESREGDQEEYLEAMTVSDSTRPSSAINWIHGINEVEKRKFRDYSRDFSVSNLEAIIIDTVASIESVTSSNFYYGLRDIKCRHCKKYTLEENFVNHRCYSTDQGFQDDVIARVEPGGEEVRSILCL